jgi:hypothetical protein
MDHSAALKGVYSPGKIWQFKAGGGYRLQLLKETRDETWGKGLFDFQKFSGNFEAERAIGEASSVRIGYDLYLIDFRNYTTLESQRPDLGRENTSGKALNTINHSPYHALKLPLPLGGGRRGQAELSYYNVFRVFPDQHIVLPSGSLSTDGRQDMSQIFSAQVSAPFEWNEQVRLLPELRGTYSRLYSNQNNYDAGKGQFNANFYAYTEYSLAPTVNVLLGAKPWIVTGGFNYVRRDYADRPVQNGLGAYSGGRSARTNTTRLSRWDIPWPRISGSRRSRASAGPGRT